MQKRFYVNPLLYGAILGIISALVASVLFVVAGIALLIGFDQLDALGLSLGLRPVFTFTALPGLIGGALGGYLFSRYEFTRIKGVAYGAALGAAAALVSSVAFFVLMIGFFDFFVLGFTLLATAIAAIVSGIAALVLITTQLTRNAS